jgi:hypothetical protein
MVESGDGQERCEKEGEVDGGEVWKWMCRGESFGPAR